MSFQLLCLLLSTVSLCHGLIGYDCAAKGINYTVLSLLDVGDGDMPKAEPVEKNMRIQLLQIKIFQEVKIIQCKIEVRRMVQQCSIFGYSIPDDQGEADFLHETSRDLCEQLHLTGTFTYADRHVISGLTVNGSRTIPITFAGNAEKCKGAPYTDPYGTWSDVLVTGTIKVTLVQSAAKVHTASNKIHLPIQ